MKRVECSRAVLMLILLIVFSISVIAAGCSEKEELTDSEKERRRQNRVFEQLDEYSDDDLIAYVTRRDLYPEREIDLNEIPQEDLIGFIIDSEMYPDLSLIYQEIADQCPERIGYLFDMMDEIGYYPSAFFGEYCVDMEKKIIHLCDKVQEEKVDYEDMYFPCGYTEYMLKQELEDGDKFLEGCSFCPNCFSEY